MASTDEGKTLTHTSRMSGQDRRLGLDETGHGLEWVEPSRPSKTHVLDLRRREAARVFSLGFLNDNTLATNDIFATKILGERGRIIVLRFGLVCRTRLLCRFLQARLHAHILFGRGAERLRKLRLRDDVGVGRRISWPPQQTVIVSDLPHGYNSLQRTQRR